jgi:iron complex outermembrane receptor protein
MALSLLASSINLKAEEEDAFFSLSLEDLLNIEIEVATKNKKSLADSPSTVSVFTANEINNLGINTLTQLLNLVPGFQVYSDGTYSDGGAVTARGRSSSGSNFEILVLMDGQRINDGRTGGATATNPNIALENIARVEIIRGPGSAIYGSNAFTGIINLVTKIDSNDINVAVGQYGAISTSLNYSKTIDNGTLSAFVKLYQQDGEDLNIGTDKSPKFSNKKNSGTEFYAKYSGDSFNLKARYMTRDVEGFYVLERIDDDFNRRESVQYYINGDYSWSFNKHFSAKFGAYYLNNYVLGALRLMPAGTFGPGGPFFGLSDPLSTDPFNTEFFSDSSEAGGFAELAWEVSEGSEMLFGVMHRRENIEALKLNNNFDLGMFVSKQFPINYYGELLFTTELQSDQKRNITGIFAQYDSKINDQLLFTTGARYDDYSDFGSTFNPRLGLVYKPNEGHTLKLSYGQAFRAPSPSETNRKNSSIVGGNSELKPEQIKTLELHWSQHYEKVNFSLTLFDNTITNAVALLPSAGTDLVSWQNGEEYNNFGGELEIISTLSDSIFMRASYTHFFDLPVESQKQSEGMFTLSINYDQGPWNVNLNGFRHSEMTYIHPDSASSTLVPVNLASYMVFNLNLSYQWSENSKIGLNTKNIFDEEYFTPSAVGSLPAGVINDGRIVHLIFKYDF